MLNPLYHLAAHAIVFFHKGFGPIFGADSFFAWAFSVALLVICVRILIFPLFVKQVKSQRQMALMQPRIKEIREKYGNDKQRMNQAMMELQKEHGNPLLGCLPIFLQIPLFISLFHVFTHLSPMPEGPGGALKWVPRVGLSADQIEQIARAKVWGISLVTNFNSSDALLTELNGNSTHIKIVCIALIVIMAATTFITQRQIMSRTGGNLDPQQAIVQKIMLYGSPIMLAVFGFRFPVAVLIYWLVTNLWSMGQQFFVIKKMPPVTPEAAAAAAAAAKSGGAGAKAAADRPIPARPAPNARTKSKGTRSTTTVTRPVVAAEGAPAAAANGKVSTTKKSTGTSAPAGTRSPRGTASRPTEQVALPVPDTTAATPAKKPAPTAKPRAAGGPRPQPVAPAPDEPVATANGAAAANGTAAANGAAKKPVTASTAKPRPSGGGSRPQPQKRRSGGGKKRR